MKVKLLGVRPVEFTDEKTGDCIEGISLYIAYPDEDVYGVVADKKFVKNDAAEKLGIDIKLLTAGINKDIDIELNPRGKLSSITICKQ